MKTTWGEGDAKVSVGDKIYVSFQSGRTTVTSVVKIGNKLLHCGDGNSYRLKDQQLNSQWSGSYKTTSQHEAAEERAAVVSELRFYGITHCGTTQLWQDWNTRELITLLATVKHIRAGA